MASEPTRCGWIQNSKHALDIEYHDVEWGLPCHDDAELFEKLSLESFQSGLSWTTILNKREGFRSAFAGFDPATVAAFGDDDVERLVQDAAIVRHRGKIEAALANARAICKLQRAGSSLDAYLWSAVNGEQIVNSHKRLEDIPGATDLSKAFSKQAKKDGFRFLGPTTVYALFQAAGLVNDHEVSCFRYKEVTDQP
jgi:DNA-3-methyladenine glycosylase I